MNRRAALVAAAVFCASCAARAPARPGGSSTPDPDASAVYEQATRQCRGLRTMTASLRLSGRVGDQRLRGTLLTGLEGPASLRFEAVAPFGQPLFILAGRDNRATLLLPRDNRVLADRAVPDLLERLIGLRLSASDVRLLLAGCLVATPEPSDGRAWGAGWRSVTVAPGVMAYLKVVHGVPQVVAADHASWRIDYADHRSGWPRRVRIRTAADRTVDFTATIDELEVNTAIDVRAFVADVPGTAIPMSLDELRSVAPLSVRDPDGPNEQASAHAVRASGPWR